MRATWDRVSISEVCQVESGAGFPLEYQGRKGKEIAFFKVGDMNTPGNEKSMIVCQHSISEETRKELNAFLFPPGTIVFPKIGAAIETNKKRLIVKPSCVDNNVMGIIPSKDLSTEFLYFLLLQKDLMDFANPGNPPSIRKTVIEEWDIPLPPLPEQQRIAAILQKADRVRRLRRYARELSESVLQGVFLEMFGDPIENPKGWKQISLGERIQYLTSGSRGWAEYYREKGDIFLRIQNIGRNRLLLNDLTYVQPPDNSEGQRTLVQHGDLLLSITADLGRTAVIPDNFPKAYINQHLALIRLNDINPTFVSGYISSVGGQKLIERLDRSGVKSGLNFDDIHGYKIFEPPTPLQNKFEIIVKKQKRVYDQLLESERQAEHLFQSLLERAFSGELGREA